MKRVKYLLSVAVLTLSLVAVSGNVKKVKSKEITETVTVQETGTEQQKTISKKEVKALQFKKKYKQITAGKTKKFRVNLKGVKWSSSNKKIATVSRKGTVKAKQYGKVWISAKVGNQSVKTKVKVLPKKIIGIDAGHQRVGNNGLEPIGPGAKTSKPKVSGGTSGVVTKKPEYVLTLEIAKKLQKKLTAKGYKVVMTRTTHDVNITNIQRAQKLNKKCDIAIRLHADGGPASARGASALYAPSSNPYVGKMASKSKHLSECILNAYCKETGLHSRGLSARNDLSGTNWSTIPVTLLEMGFMTSTLDDRYMSSSNGQKKMVNGIIKGIDEYFYGSKKR
ncbi:MAG: N-acetylmuramoyl-L-alanine amidase [Eubacterium sp.]|nr:N-acetylmuramoyl-L-alanine amidase [Eubacterium sp.]